MAEEMDEPITPTFIHFHSTCNLKFILRSNLSYNDAMHNHIKQQTHQDLLRRQLVQSVKRATIAWLIQNNAVIFHEEENTGELANHPCQLYELRYPDMLEIIASVVVTFFVGPSPQVPNHSAHEFEPFEPDHAINLLLITQCTPKLTINRSPVFHECMLNTKRIRGSCPTVSVQAVIISWMLENSIGIRCTQSPQYFVNGFILCPCAEEESNGSMCIPYCTTPYFKELECMFSDISPLLELPSQTNHALSHDQVSIEKLPIPVPTKPTPTTPSSSNDKSTKAPASKKKPTTPTHNYSTRSRNNIKAMFLQSTSRSKKKIIISMMIIPTVICLVPLLNSNRFVVLI